MEPPEQTEEQLQAAQEELQRAQSHLQASLSTPVASHPTHSNGSIPSEMRSILDLLEAQSARIEQMARTLSADQASTVKINTEMLETMRLMQLMIAETDKQQAQLVDLME